MKKRIWKQVVAALLVLVLCLTLVACDQSNRMKVTMYDDSMSPTFSSGDELVFENADPSTLEIGDIIAYWTVIDGKRAIYVSRIHQIYAGTNDQPIFETKGDNNATVNSLNVHPSNVVGKYVRKAILGLF